MKRSVEIKTKDYGPSDIHDRPLYAGRRHNVFLGGKLVGYVNEIVSVTPLGKRAGYERSIDAYTAASRWLGDFATVEKAVAAIERKARA